MSFSTANITAMLSEFVRVIAHAHTMQPEWLLRFFIWLKSDLVLQCLRAMHHVERNLSGIHNGKA